MNADEITQRFAILTNPNTPPDAVKEANDFVMQFQTTPDCLTWIFQTYKAPQLPSSIRYQQLIILKNWCQRAWPIINQNPEIQSNLQQLLFTREFHEPFRTDNNFLPKLADAQVQFMFRTFPAEWPTFWPNYFEAFDEGYILQFMVGLSHFTCDLSAPNQLIYNTIKDKMREDQSDANITQFIIQAMLKRDLNAFIAFHSLCRWVNVNYIITDDTIGCIKQGLSVSGYGEICLKIISCLVRRGMPPENKAQLIQLFDIPTQIQQISGAFANDNKLAWAASDLVNYTGQALLLLQKPEVEQYIPIALEFFSFSDPITSLGVVPFLTSLCKANPAVFQVITEKLIERLCIYFANVQSRPNQDTFLEDLIPLEKTIVNVTKQKQGNAALELIQQMWEENIFSSNPLKAISIVCFVSEVLSSNEHAQYTQFFVEQFFNIIQFPPPYNLVLSYGMIQYIKLFGKVGDKFPEEQISAVFNRLAELALTTGLTQPEMQIENDIETDMASMIDSFLNKMGSKVLVPPEIIIQFLHTSKEQLVSAAGTLIQNLRDNKQAVFDECLGQLQGLLQANSQNAVEIMPTVLLFIKSVKYTEGTLNLAQVQAFLTTCIGICNSDDKLFSLFIRTVYSCLGQHGSDIIFQCIDFLTVGYKTACGICDAAEYLLQFEQLPKDWIGPVIDKLSEPIFAAFQSVDTWDLQKDAEQQDIMALMRSFIHLFASSLKFFQFINPQTYGVMKEFIKMSLHTHFDIPELVESILDFIAQMLQHDPEPVFTEFSNAALNILMNEQFDPNKRPWPKVCKRILKLHREMMQVNPEKASHAIMETYSRFNGTMENITNYIEIVKLQLPREMNKAGMEWFVNFANNRKLME